MLTIIYKIKLCILIFSISLFINPFLAKAQNKDRNLTLKGRNINKFDGFIALGCIIKGQTPHFDLLSTTRSRPYPLPSHGRESRRVSGPRRAWLEPQKQSARKRSTNRRRRRRLVASRDLTATTSTRH